MSKHVLVTVMKLGADGLRRKATFELDELLILFDEKELWNLEVRLNEDMTSRWHITVFEKE